MLCLESLVAGYLHLRLSLAISSCDIHSCVNSLDCTHQVLCKPMLPVVIQQLSKATDADDLICTLALGLCASQHQATIFVTI